MFRQDPKTHQETYRVKLDLIVETSPPQRFAIGTLREPSCRRASSPEEVTATRGTALGGLVCYHAGYGDYVVVAEDKGKLVVTAYGQSESVIGDENPPRRNERTIAHLPWNAGTPVTIDLEEPDGGAVLP
jgi:hypothetical protein